jgi:hypothetical protein
MLSQMTHVSMIAYQLVPLASTKQPVLFVQEFDTLEPYRGRQYGSMLLFDLIEHVCKDDSRAAAITEMHLVVDESNADAIRLYRDKYHMRQSRSTDDRVMQGGKPMQLPPSKLYFVGDVDDVRRALIPRAGLMLGATGDLTLSYKTIFYASQSNFMFDNMNSYKTFLKSVQKRDVKKMYKDVKYAVFVVAKNENDV